MEGPVARVVIVVLRLLLLYVLVLGLVVVPVDTVWWSILLLWLAVLVGMARLVANAKDVVPIDDTIIGGVVVGPTERLFVKF